MKRRDMIGIGVVVLLVVGYIVFDMWSRRVSKDGFQAATAAVQGATAPRSGPVGMIPAGAARGALVPTIPVVTDSTQPVEVPYAEGDITNLGDYEYNFVYQQESDKALTKEMRDKLMSQYPMDWSGYPPSSAQFQAGLRESFENATPSVPDSPKPYANVSGETMTPPDNQKVEREERKILQTYVPKFPPSPTTYDPKDVDELIKKMYEKKGLVPEVKHREGTNVYEIVGVRKPNEVVQYEDEAPASTGAVTAAGEMTTPIPRVAQDQFFEPSQKQRADGRWDYTAWTAGLERMFAPNQSRQNWY